MSLKKKAEPHYYGHRQRLRDRFLKDPSSLPDYELLELILYFAYPRQDTKPKAKDLLQEHKSFVRVFHLMPPHIHANLFYVFQLMNETARRLSLEDIKNSVLLNNSHKVIEYCRITMAHLSTEHFCLFFLNCKYYLICQELQQGGTVDMVSLHPREVIKRALELNAVHIIMAHNHPSGDPSPSQADIEITKHLRISLSPFNVSVLDHFIIGANGYFSFREQGILGN
jgi:DNA repair protein RadC